MKDKLAIETVKDAITIFLTNLVTFLLQYPTNRNTSMFYIILMIVPLILYYKQMVKYKEEGENHYERIYHDLYIEKLFALKAFGIIEFCHILILIGRWY